MIVANLATYPARHSGLMSVVNALSPQVDRLNIVLNEYSEVPNCLYDISNVNSILPHEDTKDVGKFYPDVSDAEWVFFIDDDVEYPSDYVKLTVDRMRELGNPKILGGYHTSIYRKPKFRLEVDELKRLSIYWARWWKAANLREVTSFQHEVKKAFFVDQVATNSGIIAGNMMPPYSFMRTSQKFVDVRLALWCFEKKIVPVALPREANWLSTDDDDESIFRTFTSQHHRHVANEIWSFAFKRKYAGQYVEDNFSLKCEHEE